MDPRIPDLLLDWEDRRDQGRPANITELCADCPELADELARRVRALEAMAPVLSLADDAGEAPPEALPAVPGFSVECEIGRGGMGVVYKARQLDPDRPVALKMIRAVAKAGPRALARFRTEAAALTRLDHANVVKVYAVGEHGDCPYLALEYCAGGSLDRWLFGRPLPARDAAALAATLARAAHHCHTHEVVHRDLKPGNVLLVSGRRGHPPSLFPTPDALFPKIADFGLAKLLDADGKLTRSGTVLGTVAYMAPEQAAGRGKTVGPAADVYSLGAMLYEFLTGRPPFQGGTGAEVIGRVLDEAPVPPVDLQPDCPPGLSAVCLRCLAKDPADRYPSAAALADDLDRARAGQPIELPPAAPAAAPAARRRWWPFGG